MRSGAASLCPAAGDRDGRPDTLGPGDGGMPARTNRGAGGRKGRAHLPTLSQAQSWPHNSISRRVLGLEEPVVCAGRERGDERADRSD